VFTAPGRLQKATGHSFKTGIFYRHGSVGTRIASRCCNPRFNPQGKEQEMTSQIKKGDHVEWKSSQGTIAGTVEKKLTSPTDIKTHHVAATRDDPQYLVKSDKTGAVAAHKPEALKKK
jgi:hypothetical protein